MGANTKIEWADHTFNPWVGCTKVSPACDHCYAESWAKRAGHPELWRGERRRTSAENWRKVYTWNRKAVFHARRPRVFVASLADVFDNQVPDIWRANLWDLIGNCRILDFLLLTKRPQNIVKMLPPDWGRGRPNVWVGATVEDQVHAEKRIPHLLGVWARVNFLSIEPLLGPIDLTAWIKHPALKWVICGGESGPKARPMHPDWARSLRDQCAAAGVPFFFKQWGEFAPGEIAGEFLDPEAPAKGKVFCGDGLWRDQWDQEDTHYEDQCDVFRIGKKRAGRLLDGIEHSAFPLGE